MADEIIARRGDFRIRIGVGEARMKAPPCSVGTTPPSSTVCITLIPMKSSTERRPIKASAGLCWHSPPGLAIDQERDLHAASTRMIAQPAPRPLVAVLHPD
jgi:hypothetical protein